MKKELVIALDAKGHKVVVINEILFQGKRLFLYDIVHVKKESSFNFAL